MSANTPFLALDHRNGSFQVLQYTGASAEPIGPSFGSTPENHGENSASMMMANRVVKFRHPQDIIAFAGNDIWHYFPGATEEWQVVHSLASPGSNRSRRIGPFVTYVNNQPLLVCCYETSTAVNRFIPVTSTDGITWVEGPEDAVPSGGYALNEYWGEHVYRNVIYWFGIQDSGSGAGRYPIVFSYDPAAGDFAHFVATTGSQPEADQHAQLAATTYKGKHYCIAKRDGVNDISLFELSANSYNFKGNLFVAAGGSITHLTTKWALFVSGEGTTDGPKMYAICACDRGSDIVNGWVCYEIEGDGVGPFTFTDLTQIVIPNSFRPTNSSAQVSSTAGCGVYYDRVNDKHTLYFANSRAPSNIWSVYDWNGPATLIGNNGSPNDQGGDASHAMSFDQTGSGSRVWEENQINIVIEDRVPIENGERFFFTLHGGEGSGTTIDTVKLEVYFTDMDHQTLTQGTITGISPSGSMNGNTAEGLDVDDGATLYSIDWLTVSDGLVKGQPVRRQLRIFV